MKNTLLNLSHIATLARLKLSDTELSALNEDLTNILQLFNTLQTINTDNIEPMAHPLELPQRLRNDEVTEVDQHQIFQAIAPSVENDLYLVPKVIESE